MATGATFRKTVTNNERATQKFKPKNGKDEKGRFVKGNREGNGRSTMALMVGAREFILGCINGEAGMRELIIKIYKQALAGRYPQQELILNYVLGKPVDRLKIEAANGRPLTNSPIVNIIADHLRLEKLNKDIEEAQIVDIDRIKEAEEVLTAAVKAKEASSPTVSSPPKLGTSGAKKKLKKK